MSPFWQLDKAMKPMGLKREYVKLMGDLAGASLLSQIVYWNRAPRHMVGGTKLRVVKNGKFWIAKHREDWMEECQITLHDYKQNMGKLVKYKLVELERYMFAGKVTPHVYLDLGMLYKAFSCVTNPPKTLCSECDEGCKFLSIGGNSTNPLAEFPPIHWLNSDQTIQKITTENTTKNTTAGKPAEEPMKLEEVLKGIEVKKKAAISSVGFPLMILWKKRLSSIYAMPWVKDFTGKESGQFKYVKTALGERAEEVFEYVLSNWSAYCWRVGVDKGLAKTPAKPHIGFFAAHYEIALQLIAEKSKPVKVFKPLPGEHVDEHGEITSTETKVDLVTEPDHTDEKSKNEALLAHLKKVAEEHNKW